jgi:hypothetical protein
MVVNSARAGDFALWPLQRERRRVVPLLVGNACDGARFTGNVDQPITHQFDFGSSAACVLSRPEPQGVIALTPTLRFYGCEPAGFAIVLSFEHVHDRSLSDRDVEARHEWDDSTLSERHPLHRAPCRHWRARRDIAAMIT